MVRNLSHKPVDRGGDAEICGFEAQPCNRVVNLNGLLGLHLPTLDIISAVNERGRTMHTHATAATRREGWGGAV